MKNFLRIVFPGIIAIFSCVGMNAQDIIPNDPDVVIGKLDNGMTYYLWQNSKPKGCADFYIVHNVGALQEEDNQNGLAHFLEHMAFNGTKHYPDKGILEFLEKEGVRFGYNVNAYTSRNETVYNISSVPLVRESFVDSVLMVLHDWSCDITCDNQALDDERGVISEEWRRRDDIRTRMALKQMDLAYRGSKHTKRSVLGTLEIINGFKRQEILDFYHKWYRPDLQAIVVVGDFDIQDMEARVRRLFSDIPAQQNPAQKEVCPIVPFDGGTLFENMNDPDLKYHTLKVIHRQSFPIREERGGRFYLKDMFARQILTNILEERLKIAVKKEDSPLKSAVIVTSPSNVDFYTSLFTLSPKNEELSEEALAFYTREIKRFVEYGISEEEFDAAKTSVFKKYRLNNLSSSEDVTSKEKVSFCKENFLRGIPCCNPAEYKKIQKEVLEGLDMEFVEKYIRVMFTDSEKIYSYSINSKKEDKLPSAERMKEIIAECGQEELEPEYISYKTLDLNVEPQAGSIVKTSPLKEVKGGEVWKLNNGVTVYWLPSEKVKSDIHLAMTAVFDTGCRVFPQENKGTAVAAKVYLDKYLGFSNMDRMELRGVLGPGEVSINVKFGREYTTLNVYADQDDVEKAFKMAYLQLMSPNLSTEKSLEKYKKDYINSLKKGDSNAILFDKESRKVKYGNDPWLVSPDSIQISNVDFEMVKQMLENSFADYDKMSIFVASDLDKEMIQGMVAKYIASLSGKSGVKKAKYIPITPAYKGKVVMDRTYASTSAPKGNVHYCFCTKFGNTPKDKLIIDILDFIMSHRSLNQIREVRGGTYSVQFISERYSGKNGCTESSTIFQTRPEMVDILVDDVADLMEKMAAEGPTAGEMDAAVKYLIKHYNEKKPDKDNSLRNKLDDGMEAVLYDKIIDYDYEAVVKSITAGDVQKAAKKLNSGNKYISIFREL